ncbi:MAG: GatB/YqeY domain-containing protein [Brevinematales bacterium]|jgi:uncharacterized protein YqeY
MAIFDDIQKKYIDARKKQDKFLSGVLSMLVSDLKYEIINKKKDLTDEDVLVFIQKTLKQKRDVMQEYIAANRTDLSDKEKSEIEYLSTLLPPALAEEELADITRQAIKETGASSPSDMGKVMKEVMAQTRGRADGAAVKNKVSELLKNL